MAKIGYKGNAILLGPTDVIVLTREQIAEYRKCMRDPIYFIKNYMKIKPVDGGELILFNLWPFQEKMIKTFHENRFTICLNPRQSGKTMCVVAYILWYALFNENVTAAILANKEKTAKETLGRVALAYENIPIWMKQGVFSWNKSDLSFGNGSKIVAGSTSTSTIRGYSISLLFCDEFAHVDKNKAEEFYRSVYPTISSGKKSKIIIASTPNGLNIFYKMWYEAGGLDPSDKISRYVPLEFHWSEVPGRDENWKQETISNTSPEQFRQEFECEFLGSSPTLISGAKLKELVNTAKSPIHSMGDLDIHEWPITDQIIKEETEWPRTRTEPGHTYAICADVARGLEMDASAFSVIDVSQIPYKQVAKYKSNKISPMLYPTQIYNAARLYNNAYVLVEISDVGQQVADILHFELEYENVVKVMMKGKQGQQVSAGFQKRLQLGLKTSHPTKRAGCGNLKTLIESNQLTVIDKDTVNELKVFTEQNDTFKAEEGYHDDLSMSLVLFGWLISQRHFREALPKDMRKILQHQHLDIVEDDIVPFGVVDNHENDMSNLDLEENKDEVWEEDRKRLNPFDSFGYWDWSGKL